MAGSAKVVAVELKAKVDGFVSGMRAAKASVDDVTKAAAPKKADAFKALSDKAAIAGVGIAGAMTVAAKRFADFDQAMSAVKANSGAAGAELDALRAQAIKLGAASQFSATEAAQGINELAKAGVKSADILSGGLKGSLDLAAAGQISVADAAETAATAMTQFKLSGDKVPHVADLLANAANKAQGGVGDMGAALKQAGLVAASTGLSIEETTAGLTAFASAGLLGSDAGTSFKTMLQRLSAPTADAQKQMNQLGISAYDSQGNFIGLANVAEQLKTGLSKLTPEQRNAALATIFGSDAIRAANVLYEQGAAGINKWTAAVSEQGAAAKQAATLTDNLKGDIERLGGALDSVFIQSGSSANGSLRTLVQGLTGVVDAVGKIPGPVLLAGGAFASLALVAPKGISLYREYKAQMDGLGLSLDKVSAKAPRTGRALGALSAGVKGYASALAILQATTALTDNGDFAPSSDVAARLGKSTDAVKEFDKALKSAGNNKFAADDDVKNFGDAVKNAFNPNILRSAQDKVAGLFGDVIPTKVRQGEDAIKQLDAALAALATSQGADVATAKFNQFAAVAKQQGVSVDELKSKLPQYAAALDAAGSSASSAATGQTEMGDGVDQVQQAAEDAKGALDKYVEGLQNAGLVVLSTRAAQRDMKQSIEDAKDSINKNRDALIEQRKAAGDSEGAAKAYAKAHEAATRSLDINTEAGRNNQAALDKVAQNALDLADSIYKETGSEEKMRASLVTSRDQLIKTYLQFDNNKKRAEAYADAILKIPAAKNTKATFTTVGLSELKTAGEYLKNLHDKHVTLTVGTIKVGDTKVNAGQFAGGGAAVGPGTGTSDDIPAMLSNGEHVLTASDVQKAGGQGAIYRMRTLIQAGRLKFAKGGAVGFADGGAVDFSAILALLGDLTSWDDVLKARGNSASKANAVRSAVSALRSLQAQQAKVKRDLNGATGNKRADLLDKQRVLLGKVAAAEGKLTAARKASTDAARAQQKVEAQYRADKAPIIDRATAAANSTNKITKAFLDNIEKLNRMGFRTLALQLLQQGGPEAEQLAAQAAASVSKARALSSSFATSAALDARATALQATLSNQSSSRNVIVPTWRGPGREVGGNVFNVDVTAYGNDAEAATRRAMSELNYRMGAAVSGT